jgi:hypothetical protein
MWIRATLMMKWSSLCNLVSYGFADLLSFYAFHEKLVYNIFLNQGYNFCFLEENPFSEYPTNGTLLKKEIRSMGCYHDLVNTLPVFLKPANKKEQGQYHCKMIYINVRGAFRHWAGPRQWLPPHPCGFPKKILNGKAQQKIECLLSGLFCILIACNNLFMSGKI